MADALSNCKYFKAGWGFREGQPPILIINETMARSVFPDGGALGKKRITVGYPRVPREIIGVVGAVRTLDLEKSPRQEIFLPYQQGRMPPATLAIRTVGDPTAIASAVREAIAIRR